MILDEPLLDDLDEELEDILTAYCDNCLVPFWKDHDKSFLCPKCVEKE